MSVLVTSNEPKDIRELFADRLEIPMGFDIKLLTKSGKIGIERKSVPGDLIASLRDGRLHRELRAMREETDYQFVVLHGEMQYKSDGTLKLGYDAKKNTWNRSSIRNLRRTLEIVEGVYIEEAETDKDLVDIINEIQEYFDLKKSKHLSFRMRPKLQSDWIKKSRPEEVMCFYQGLPGISIVRSKALWEKFPSPEDLYKASVDEIMEIPRFGKDKATNIYNFLRQGNNQIRR